MTTQERNYIIADLIHTIALSMLNNNEMFGIAKLDQVSIDYLRGRSEAYDEVIKILYSIVEDIIPKEDNNDNG